MYLVGKATTNIHGKGNIFVVKGQKYKVIEEMSDRYLIIDETGCHHTFTKEPDDDGLSYATWFYLVSNNEQIENNFKYHAPKPGQPEMYTQLREEAKQLAYLIDESCPNSREKSLAMTNLEQSVFWANASIARN